MPRGTCEPCCNPSELARSEATFRTGTLIVLCDILEALGGGVAASYRFDWELLCDPSDGAAVFVKFAYATDGSLQAVTAVNPDGTAYGGAVASLVSCNEFWQSGGSSGGTSMQDDSPYTVGTTDFTPAGGTYRTVRDSVNDGDGGAFAMTATRALYTTIETPAGDTAMDEVNDALRVNVVAGSTGGPGKVDDSAFSIGVDSVNPIGALADETAPDSVNEGDVGLIRMSLNRVLFNIIRDAAGNERGANVTAANELMVNVGNATLAVTQSGTWNINNISGTISLPTGAATSALQTTGNTSLATIAGAVSGTEMQVDVITMPPITATNLDIRDLVFATDKVDVSGSTVDTELPAAAALADNTANPTTTSVGVFPHWYDGATWDRARGDSTDGLLVNLGSNNDVTVTGTVAVTQSGTWNINNISGTISLPTGASTLAEQQTQTTALQLIDNLVFVDDAAFTPGTTSIVMAGGTYRSTRDSVDNNDGGAFAMTQTRALYTSIETPLGDSAMDDTNDALRVNVVAGSVGGPGKVDDSAFSIGVDSVNPIGALADETAPDSVNEGDVGLVRMSLNRILFNIIRDAAGNERGANVNASNQLSVSVDNTPTVNAAQSGTWNINNISGTISLPTGASTSALQTTGNTSLATIAGAVSGTEMQVDVITMPTVTVTATNLDIRDLVFATDKVDVSGSTVDTELPAAATLTDNFANPTAPAVGAFGMLWDGATWDRAKGDSTDGALVNLGANNDVTVTGTVAVTQSGTWNITNISGTISLPTGASTLAEQQSQTTALQLIDNLVFVDDAAFTPGTTSIVMAGGTYRSTRDSVDNNDGGAFAMTQTRALYTSIETPLGDSAMDDTNDAVRVNVVAGSSGGPGKVDDSAFGIATDSVNPIGALADETGPDSVNEGDVGLVRMSLNRVLYSQIRDAAGNERGLNVDANGAIAVTQATAANLNAQVQGPGASGAALTGNPVRIGVSDGTNTLNVITAGTSDSLSATASGLVGVGAYMRSVVDNTWTRLSNSGADGIGVAALLATNSYLFNSSTADKLRSVGGAFDTTGTGVAASGVMGQFDDTSPVTISEGNYGSLRVSANRNLYNTIRDAAGNERGANVNAANELLVSVGSMALPTGAATSANQTTEITSLQLLDDIVKTDDAAFTPGTDKVAMIGAEYDNTSPDSVDEGDAGALRMSSTRSLYVQIRDGGNAEIGLSINGSGQLTESNTGTLLARLNTVIDQILTDIPENQITVGGSDIDTGTANVLTLATGRLMITGPEAIDNPLDWFPMPMGGYASSAVPTAVSADGDSQYVWLNLFGAVKTVMTDDAGDSCMDGTNNALRVNIVAGAGSGGTAMVDDAAFTVGTTNFTPAGGTYKTTRDAVDDNDGGAFAMTAKRGLYTSLETPLADSAMDDTADAVKCLLVQANGTAMTSTDILKVGLVAVTGGIPLIDDSAFVVATDRVIPVGLLADDTASDSVDEGDVGIPRMSLNRIAYHILRDAAGNERGANVTAANALVVDGSAVTQPVSVAGTVAVTQSGTWNITNISGTISLPTGASTSANQTTMITSLQLIDDVIKTDDAAFTPATDKVAMIGAEFDDTTPDSVDEGDAGAIRMSANRNLYVRIRDNAGNERGLNVDASGNIAVTQSGTWNITNVSGTVSLPTGASTLAEQQTQTTALQLIDNIVFVDDAAFTPATTSIVMAGFTFDDTSPDSVNEGDGGAARMSANRNQYMTIRDAAGNERGVNVNASNQLSVSADAVVPGTGATNLGKAEDAAHTTGDVGVMALAVANEGNTARAADNDYLPIATDTEGNPKIVGNRDHDAVDAGEPVKVGMKAIAHGTNPTAVAAADRSDVYCNRAGIPFVIGGHPNIVTIRANYTSAQTDTAIVTVAGGLKIVVTRVSVTADKANTVDVQARIGFATTNTPTTTGVVLSHPGIAAGSGVIEGNGSGILGIGADGEDLRITSEAPTTGSIDVVVSYYTIES